MTDIALTAAHIGLCYPKSENIRSYIAAATITKGQAVYFTTDGTVGVADANDSGKQQFRGIALNGGGAGQAIDVLHEGEVYGFTISGLDADVLVYLSDTAGALADAAGTMTVAVGRVVCLSDKGATKVLRISTSWFAQWA